MDEAGMDIARRGQFDCSVLSNTALCREHFRLTLLARHFPATEPGQFIQIACQNLNPIDPMDKEIEWIPGMLLTQHQDELDHRTAMLRRPFSIAGRRDTNVGVEIDIIGRTVGIGTDWMSKLQPNDTVNIIGPLGNAFTLPPPGGIALMVGGGVGIPPMIYLSEKLSHELSDPSIKKYRKGIAFCGATTHDLLALTITNDAPIPHQTDLKPLFNITEFAISNVPAIITTDDGSYGFKGYVTQALEQYLDQWITDNADRNRTIIYTCGPEIMMKRVAQIAEKRNITCQICVERAMACGMGTCQSCCLKVKKENPQLPPLPGNDWCYKLACTDGPVFDSTKLIW